MIHYRTAKLPSSEAYKASADRMAHKLAVTADTNATWCVLFGCTRPTQAAAKQRGLSATYCRYHAQLKNRHGSFTRKSFTSAELAPYTVEAERCMGRHMESDVFKHTLDIIATSLRGQTRNIADAPAMTTEEKVRATFARMRDNKVHPLAILLRHVTITAAVADGLAGVGTDAEEFRVVQIGKAALKLGGGQHWTLPNGQVVSRYPRSAGLLVRALGRRVDEACGPFGMAAAEEVRQAFRARVWASADLSEPIHE